MLDHQPIDESPAERDSAASGKVNRRAFLSGAAVGMVGGGALAYGAVQTELRPPSASISASLAAPAANDGSENADGVTGGACGLAIGRGSEPVDLIVALIRQRYPDNRLDQGALDVIRDGVVGQLRRSRVLSSFPLKNGDRPAVVFTPFVADSGHDV